MGVRGAVVKTTGQHTAGVSIGGRDSDSARYLRKLATQGLLIAASSCALFWLVWLYANSLRHTRYLDGWVLAGGMIIQLGFHIAIKAGSLGPKSIARFKKFHIFLGYLLIAVFIVHSDFSLPDTAFEWALWTAFVVVSLSGIFGAYVAWLLQV